MNILAIIPARSGSKSIPNKNIISLYGKPLIAYSIEHANESRLVNRTIVSTDSKEYAAIATAYGAEVPFLRPEDISGDLATDFQFMSHALQYLAEHEGYIPEYCVQLRPTHPVRNPMDIDRMIEMLIANPRADSVRSIVQNRGVVPFKMWFKDDKEQLKPLLLADGISESYNAPRQILPVTYQQNASIDVIRTSCILEKHSISGEIILGYEMDEQYDIDYIEDFARVQQYLLQKQTDTVHKYCIDIDGVIAHLTPGNDYSKARPIMNNIDEINVLFSKGNRIVLHTARGFETGIDWREVTIRQLQEWGVQYHEIYFGKPSADFYIDDKAVNAINFFNNRSK